MGYDRVAPRRKVELELNGDLLRRVSEVSPDLAETVERLAAEHPEKAGAFAAYLEASNERCERLGDWADDLVTEA